MRNKRTSLVVVLTACLAVGSILAAEPARTPEEARESMRTLVRNFGELGAHNSVLAQRAARLEQSLDRMTPLQVDLLAESLAAAPGALDSVDQFNAGLAEELAPMVGEVRAPAAEPVYSETCGDTRPDAATVADQLAMWESLAAAAAAAQATCDGADAASAADACEVAGMANDAALMARFTYENSAFCNGDIDSVKIDATLATLFELSDSLGGISLAEHDEAVRSLIQAEAELLREQLDLVLTDLTTHDTAVQNLIQAEAQLLREQVDLVLTNQVTILANQDALMQTQQGILEGIEELRQLMLTPLGRRPGWNGRDGNNGNGNGN